MIRKFYLWAIVILLLLLVFTAGRCYLLWKYYSLFAAVPVADILRSFARGARFDLATSVLVTLPVMGILFVPIVGRIKAVVLIALALMFVLFEFLIFYTAGDIEYFAYVQRHLDFEGLALLSDMDALTGIGLSHYAPQLIVAALAMIAFGALFFFLTFRARIVRNMSSSPFSIVGLIGDFVAIGLVAGLAVVTIRGGLQMKPMGPRNAFIDERVELGMLSLNGIYTSLHSAYDHFVAVKTSHVLNGLRSLEGVDANAAAAAKRFIIASDRETSQPQYPLYRRYNRAPAERRPLNVVLLIMESWSAMFSGATGGAVSGTPFFDRLAPAGLLLTNCFANGQRSVEGLAALLGSVPVTSYGEIPYAARFEPVGAVFKNYGYETLFIHGAKQGTMGFDALVRRIGIERALWRQAFTNLPPNRFGVWGVFDEFVLRRAHEEFAACRGPFLGVVYSLSSHIPYDLPPFHPPSFGEEEPHHAFLNALRYSDYSLERFFAAASSAPYFTNTLFVIVSDHTEGRSTGSNFYDAYRIPCLFYAPGLVEPGTIGAVTSQLDVVPTIYDLLRIDTWFNAWGKSALAPADRRTLLPHGELLIWVDDPHMLLANAKTPMALYNWRNNPIAVLDASVSGDQRDRLFGELQAYLRFSRDQIIYNRLAPTPEVNPPGKAYVK